MSDNKTILNAAPDSELARLRAKSVKAVQAEAKQARDKIREINRITPEVDGIHDFDAAAAKVEGKSAADLKEELANALGALEACNAVNAAKTESQSFRFAENAPICGEGDIQQRVYYKGGGAEENLFDRMERLHGATELEKLDLKEGAQREIDIETAVFDDILNTTMTKGVGGSANPPTGITPDRPLTIERPYEAIDKRRALVDILPRGTTMSDVFKYRKEIDAGQAIAGTSPGNYNAVEAATAVQQSFGTKEESVAVETLRAYGTITEEQAADVRFARPYASMLLSRNMKDVTEAQLVKGSGTSPQITGLNSVSDTLSYAKPNTNTLLEAWIDIFEKYEQARDGTGVLKGSGTSPSHVVLRPSEHRRMQKSVSTDGWFLYGDPASGQLSSIWGVPIVYSDFVDAATAFIICADPRYILFVQRQGVSIQTGWNNDDFAKNQRSLRITQRCTLAVPRPATILKATALNTAKA